MRLLAFLHVICWLLPAWASSFQSPRVVAAARTNGPPIVGSFGPSRCTCSKESSTQLQALLSPKLAALAVLRGGARVLMDEEEIIGAAYDWCTNLGNPAALVAGAVIATIYETMNSGALDLQKSDSPRVKTMKKVTRLLLLSAFALEVFSIFVTTVTGTMLLSKNYDIPEAKHYSAISFLRENFEFEYLTARLTFLQGLLNWLAAIGLNHAIPQGETGATRKINKLVAYSLSCTGILMLSFWNTHLTHYRNYGAMVLRWCVVTWTKFIWKWPPQPLSVALVPTLGLALKMAYDAFADVGTEDDQEAATA